MDMTMDIYTGAREQDKRKAAAQVARSFLGAVNEVFGLSNLSQT